MPESRIETLQSMLDRDPSNGFVRYGLAMEYVKADCLKKAAEEFSLLLDTDPSYVAGYYHGGQTLEKLGQTAEARDLYRRGLEACKRKGDAHTAAEIQAALDLLA